MGVEEGVGVIDAVLLGVTDDVSDGLGVIDGVELGVLDDVGVIDDVGVGVGATATLNEGEFPV